LILSAFCFAEIVVVVVVLATLVLLLAIACGGIEEDGRRMWKISRRKAKGKENLE
jgi:hypothetical protein